MGQNYGDDGTRLIKAVIDRDIDEVTECLKDKKYSIESADSGDRTALYWAAKLGLADIVKLLLEAGANPDRESSDELVETPRRTAETQASINIDALQNNLNSEKYSQEISKKISFDEIFAYFDAYDAQKTKSCNSEFKSRFNQIVDKKESSHNAQNDDSSHYNHNS